MTLSANLDPFVGAGFALHWLYAKQKRPIGDDWQNAPVATLDDLLCAYVAGNNVGVRLGEPSKVGGYYLHLIDLDIRKPDLADEAWAAFAAALPDVDPNDLPCVISGSGGESRHLYFLTDKPFYGKKLAVSQTKHRRRDRLKNKEVWSHDWEVELFGTGRQAVTPPSVHPESRLPYTWLREFDFEMLELGIAPYIPSSAIDALGVTETAEYEFESHAPLIFKKGILEGYLNDIPLHHLEDRGGWLTLGMALHHQFGGSDEGFDLWMQHSARSSKFLLGSSERAELRRYRHFGKNRRAPVTLASVIPWAQEGRKARLAAWLDEGDDR